MYIALGIKPDGRREVLGFWLFGADWQMCVLHAVRDALAQSLRAVYRAPEIVAGWEAKADALLAFLKHPRENRPNLSTTNQLERLVKEVKRRVKVVGSLGRRRWKSSFILCFRG